MVKASWLGDEGHEAAMSSAVSFSVEGAFPTMILVGIGLVIVIASITAVILLRRKKGHGVRGFTYGLARAGRVRFPASNGEGRIDVGACPMALFLTFFASP